MRIAFAIGDLFGCGFYRCLQPAKMLSDAGHDVSVHDVVNNRAFAEADVVIAQRQFNAKVLESMDAIRQKYKTPIIFEIDDDLFNVPSSSPANYTWHKGSRALQGLERFIKASDGVIVSTEGLAEEISKRNPNVAIVPNCVNLQMYPQQLNDNGDTIKVGWSGSTTHYDDLQILKSLIKKMLKKYKNVQMNFIGYFPVGLFFDLPHEKIRYLRGTGIFHYPEFIAAQNLDIGLAPIISSKFNKSKSDLKYLEYSACRVPTVASDFGEYAAAIKHGKSGLLSSDTEWEKNVFKLIEDVDYRRKLATNAYEYVKKERTTDTLVKRYEKAFKKLGVWR